MLRRQVGGVLSLRLLGMALVFVTQIWLARQLSITDFGVVVYLLSLLSVAGLCAKFGLDTVSMRFVAIYRTQGNRALLAGLVFFALSVVFLFGIVAYVVLGQINLWFGVPSEVYAPYIPLLLGLLPFLPLQNITASILRGMEAPVAAEIVDTGLRYLLVLAALAALFVIVGKLTIEIVLLVYTLSTVACFAAGLALIFRKWASRPWADGLTFRATQWTKAGAALWLSGGLYMLMNQVDTLMLGQMSGPESVGRYAVASRVTGIVGMGLGAVMTVIAPMLAEIHARDGKRVEMQARLSEAARITFAIIAVSASALLVLGSPILSIFGAEFVVAYIPMMVLTLSRVVEAFAGPAGQLLAMVGMHSLVAWLMVGPAILNIALNFVLIPHFGETGAAVATLTSVLLWNALLLHAANRRLGVDPSLLSILKPKSRS